MSVREYVGSRYVPVFADPLEWNSANTYEPLTIVLYQGNSYTSRQAVPAGIAITNTAYWAQTGNYNAQIEQYRQEVQALDTEIDNLLPVSIGNGGTGATDAAGARTAIDAAQSNGATNTLYDAELAIAENAADIADLQNLTTINQIIIDHDFQSSTTLSYTGLSFTIPALSIYGISTEALFVNNLAQDVVLSTSSDPSKTTQYIARCRDSDLGQGSARCYITGLRRSSITLYVHAKYSAVGQNRIAVTGWSRSL